jgi:hypothetical protein
LAVSGSAAGQPMQPLCRRGVCPTLCADDDRRASSPVDQSEAAPSGVCASRPTLASTASPDGHVQLVGAAACRRLSAHRAPGGKPAHAGPEPGVCDADGRDTLQLVAASSERTRPLELFQRQTDQGPLCPRKDGAGHIDAPRPFWPGSRGARPRATATRGDCSSGVGVVRVVSAVRRGTCRSVDWWLPGQPAWVARSGRPTRWRWRRAWAYERHRVVWQYDSPCWRQNWAMIGWAWRRLGRGMLGNRWCSIW